MFLRRMEIKGFKSFAHPTVIEFTDGLTVIVGPNGSGKSNINDAFKWVLGEASKKTLRASTASDMIFAGSDSEKEADFAEVTLIFNNEDRVLEINYNEVAITRRTFRDDKQNEYYINKDLVRRRDVKDLFLGTGLGNTDLSIISQGSVTKITDSKPKELRELLNEAAGVSKYELQKNESVRKLEKVSQSLEIFQTKLRELEKQVGPLKKKKEIAEKYLAIKEELGKIELPIMKEELTLNIENRKTLNSNIAESADKKNLAEESLKNIEIKTRELQEKVISLDNELYSLQTKQNELNSKSIISESDEKGLEEAIKNSVKGIKDIKGITIENVTKEETLNGRLKETRTIEFDLISKRDRLYQGINNAEYEIQKISKSKLGALSRGSQSIMDNKDIFNEVYGTVGQLVTFNKKFEVAVQNSIGNKLNNIVVSDEETIKEAISFLKSNKSGRATFVPVKKVKPRIIPEEYYNAIKTLDGFIGTMSSILKAKPIYKNVLGSIGGHILVFEDIETGLEAAKVLGYKYEIVTIEGDQIFTGFTVRGGTIAKGGRTTELKRILKTLQEQYQQIKQQLNNNNENIQSIRDSLSFIQIELVRSQDRTAYLESDLKKLLDQFKKTTGSVFDMNLFQNSEEYISSDLSLEQINSRIKSIQIEKQRFSKEVMEKQEEEQELRMVWEKAISLNTDSTISLNSVVSLISKDLEILNKDYKMTYENLMSKKIHELAIPIEEAGKIREKLRGEISKLGFVDFDAVNNYEELFDSYEELKHNVGDLRESKDKLLSTIETMDKEMISQFSETFEKVNIEFQKTFQTLFRGGQAQMEYTEPDDILNTGVEILAKLPGKIVKSLSLYSGGEKSLVSLSLIFAINAVKELPILMLDEVEASLDESNVERFAKFAKKLNNTTQVVITSHRPGTMEQADILYGVTMQTKGITNILSVKLTEAIEMSE